ncbi:hypothetical protein BYT27DRAFT_7249163 [Phlegmacium glaucopus]|nr:hypothetical protein BYT27DRAFT_7249163 [Phlegmacium glaucopus]
MNTDNESALGASSNFNSVVDRGPPKRSKPWVAWNFTRSFWTLFLVTSFSGGYFVYNTIHTGYILAKDPHRSLYQDLTATYGQQDVVHPLVDANQTFDIVATVWLRADREPPANVTKDGTPVWRDPLALVETAIFTETIFRGLRLRDKNVKTAVNFRVPTEIFKKKELYTYDLRGSFTLIPNSPSPLDDVLNYSSWIPPFITYPPSVSWPDGHRPSAAELLVNAYGAFMPLLSFHNVKSRCGSPQKPGDEKDTDERKGDKEETTSNPTPFELKHPFPKKGQPPLQSHPYIITRSFLRVVDMTPLYNEAAFELAQHMLKFNACSKRTARADWRLCARSFFTNGHGEFKILLRKNEPKEKASHKWAYAPYLSVADTPVAPLDLVPVPVNREDCLNNDFSENGNLHDEDFVDITWNVAFSGRTPEKLLLADYLPKVNVKYDMTDMESYDLGWKHNGIEFMQGIVGQRFHDDYHPRRAAFFICVGQVVVFFILALHYWLSLASTVGVSITGNALIAVAGIFDSLFGAIFEACRRGYTAQQFIRALSGHAAFHILSYPTLKGIMRAKFRLSKHWIPTVYFAPASHAERTSQRLDSRTTWRFKIPASLFQ